VTEFSLQVRDIPADLEEDVKAPVDDPLVFIGGEEKEALSMAAATIKSVVENSAPIVKVRVLDNYRVCHEGKAYVGGETLEIPRDEAHEIWLQSAWVEIVNKEK
jgi:hypothetical protein